MVQYKLFYFPIRGLAEMSRLMLHYAGVQFEDIHITEDEWKKIKPRLAGQDDFESAYLDSIADFIRDFRADVGSYTRAQLLNQPNKDELYETVYKPIMSKNLFILEIFLKQSGSGYFAKSDISWVDFYLATWLDYDVDRGFLKNYPKIYALKNRIFALPQLQNYLNSNHRPTRRILY